ncbi:VIT1/CCC1 transporter family protein [Salipiger mucosus]|uniref:Nodulin 21-related protein n=1 Tax=Salipiger mucosus DSM 16094 TaxID=1123237 RepID=S9S767_9RHOB|nr:VIT1/CCC1 transporter family protein [Salipiger mucosus]EPX82049.1 nodulin 21-related protein [Salipiger mucosus DSM 16094]
MTEPSKTDTPAPPRRDGHGHLRDIVYGAIDGSVTTFAIVAGVAGAGLSPFVILALGFANVLADGFSMAAGNYSATKAEHDDLARLRGLEAARIDRDPAEARTALRATLADKGLSGDTLEAATDQVTQDRDRWIALLLDGEHGLSAHDPHPMRAALATFGAFLAAGMVPLLPFLLALASAFELATVLTLVTFFGIGAYKSHWSLAPWWRSGTETLLIGGAAAGIAYVVGTLFSA